MICGKRFALLPVLCLLLSSPLLFAEVCLSDAEYQELTAIFERLGNRLDEQQDTIATLQTQLTTASEALEKSQSETATTALMLNAVKKSYDALRLEHVKTVVIAALISAVVGFVAGLIL